MSHLFVARALGPAVANQAGGIPRSDALPPRGRPEGYRGGRRDEAFVTRRCGALPRFDLRSDARGMWGVERELPAAGGVE